MGVLSSELSSWRKHLVECKAGIVNTLNFRDTRPNVMLVMNPSNAKVMSCLDSIPTEKNYDFMIKNHYARLVGRPTPTSQVYFLSDYDVTLQVYSIYDKNFDPSWLSDFSIDNVNIESESLQPLLDALKAQSKTEIAGVKDGVILPAHDEVLTTIIRQLCDTVSSMQGADDNANLSEIITHLALIRGRDSTGESYSLYSIVTAINTLLKKISDNHNRLTNSNGINLKHLYDLLQTLTSSGVKGIADITGKGADATTLKNVKDSIASIQGTGNSTLSDAVDQLTTINVNLQALNNTLLDCKTLLADIKTNTTK